MTSVFNHFELSCLSKKLKASSWVVNLLKKVYIQIFGKNIQKCFHAMSASWDFSVSHGGMYDVDWCASLKCRINKRKAIGSTLKIFHFMGCEMPFSEHLDIIWAETLFTSFLVEDITLSAADRAGHLFGTCLQEIDCEGILMCPLLGFVGMYTPLKF